MNEINGYKIFENCDDAIYVAKSKEDVYKYFVENYGSTEDCQGETKDEFVGNLREIELNSKECQCTRLWTSDDDGSESESSYYDEYKKSVKKGVNVDVIAYLVW